MTKIVVLIATLFAGMNVAGELQTFGPYYDYIIGAVIVLLISPWVANQLR